jgi:DNA-binding NtrC family response regulator
MPQQGKISHNMNLLIIDEDLSLYDTIKGSSLPKNYIIYFSRAYRDIYSFIEYNNIHVVITDLDGKKKQGLSLLKKLKNLDPLVEVIFTGKSLPSEEVMGLIKQGAIDYLTKPLRLNAVHQTLKKIFEKRVLRRETFLLEKRLEKKYFFKSMIGKSPYMLEIFSLVENISKYFSSVLITGETGTGKEMVARAIHELSPIINKDLVICDCVSIPENLFESELFGYIKGAFTGADKDKLGLFDKAHRGTIFLDEIGEIPLSIQAKLLRVLEHHQFKPLGSNENRTVDVHVIAATSRNLRECIKNRTFREDLLHRLNKVEIYIPPLRKRPEDIPLLVRHFLNRYNKQFSKKIKGVSRQVQKLFLKYEWPGNVRELENVMESAAMLSKKEFIGISDLPKYFHESFPAPEKIPFIKREQLTTLKDLEKDYISYILKLTNNNLRKSAKIMNISRTTLYNKLKRYKINR